MSAQPAQIHRSSGTTERSRLRLWRDIIKLMLEFWRAHRLAFAVMSLVLLIGNARAGLYVASIGGIVDAATLGSRAGRSIVFWFGMYIAASLIEEVYWVVRNAIGTYLHDQGAFSLRERVFRRAASAPLIQFEERSFFDHMRRATAGVGAKMNRLFQLVVDAAQVLVMLVSVAAALFLVHPLLVLVLLIGSLPAIWLELRFATVFYEVEREHAGRDRMRGHLQRLLTGRAEGSEVRLFGTAQYLLGIWSRLRAERKVDVLAAQRKRTMALFWGSMCSTVSYVVGIALVTWWIRGGTVSIGDYASVTTGALWFQSSLRGLIWVIRSAEENSHFVGDLFEFLEQARVEGDEELDPVVQNGQLPISAGQAGQPARRRAMGVQAEGITFSYPMSSAPVIKDVTLTIAPGERIAIVGDNGAGKTTLVKLLVGLYLADSGTVRLDGEKVTAANAPRLRRRIAPVFQDYARYLLTARENIGFGDIERMGDTTALERAAAKAEIATLVDELPEGFDTFLGREFGETDLSGGQWQRMALARAFFREADLLVLDEPTAALDPKAELALFQRFAELVEDRTAIMVSHRLGMCRLADRILVMEQGRIVENGTHDELLARNGKYAEFFRAQAQWYQ